MKLTNEEKQLKAAIKQIVRESLENYGAFNTYEEDNKEDDDNGVLSELYKELY